MTPEEAISEGAREAMTLIQGMRDQNIEPTYTHLLQVLRATTEGSAYVARVIAREVAQPGTIRRLAADKRQDLLREAKATAAGVLLVFALCPGVEELPAPKDLH